MLFLVLSSLLFSYLASSVLYSLVFWLSLTLPPAIGLAILKSSLQLDVEVMKCGIKPVVSVMSSHRTSQS